MTRSEYPPFDSAGRASTMWPEPRRPSFRGGCKGKTMSDQDRYTIRPKGQTAWNTADTIGDAVEVMREAKDRGLQQVIIYDEEAEERVSRDEIRRHVD